MLVHPQTSTSSPFSKNLYTNLPLVKSAFAANESKRTDSNTATLTAATFHVCVKFSVFIFAVDLNFFDSG
ncbi:MAG TPA: hypothetical protein DDY12_06125 [Porphyromonadaceae bacterium]|nr:hypothetical protein [Porphyromonadaceae bacterium]